MRRKQTGFKRTLLRIKSDATDGKHAFKASGSEFDIQVVSKLLTKKKELLDAVERDRGMESDANVCETMCKSLSTDACGAVPGCHVERGWLWGHQCTRAPATAAAKKAPPRLAELPLSPGASRKLHEIINELTSSDTHREFRLAARLQRELDAAARSEAAQAEPATAAGGKRSATRAKSKR